LSWFRAASFDGRVDPEFECPSLPPRGNSPHSRVIHLVEKLPERFRSDNYANPERDAPNFELPNLHSGAQTLFPYTPRL
jgi:hypothetical protein